MRLQTLVRSAVALAADLVSLTLPVACAGCGRGERSLCAACTALFLAPYRCEEDTVVLGAQDDAPALGLPTWTTAAYAGPARHVVLAWKSGARPDVAGAVAEVGERAGCRLSAELVLPATSVSPASFTAAAGVDLLVVPAPSGWRRRMARRLVAADLAADLARGLATGTGGRVWAADVLRRRGGSGHLLGAAARARRGRGSVRVITDLPAGTPVLIVDDVVTTGSTIHACRSALARAGAEVIGAVALAATPRPGRAPTVPQVPTS